MFPNTRFAPVYHFNPGEAQKAFQILLDVLKYVSKHEHDYKEIHTCSSHFVFDLKSADFDAVRLFEQKTNAPYVPF